MAEAVSGASSVAIIPSAGPPGVSLRGAAGRDGKNGEPGRDGIDGVDGAGVIVTRTAMVPISPWTAVISVGTTLCRPADPSNPDHRGLVIGVTALGGLPGSTITIQTAGDVQGDVGPFSAPATLFVGAAGVLTASAPTSGWRQVVARSSSTSSIAVALGEPQVILNDDALLLPDGGLATRATANDVQTAAADNLYLTPQSATALPFTHSAPQAMRRTTAGALGDKAVTPYDFWSLVVGGDHTAAVQAAFDNAQAGDFPVYLSRAFNVVSVTAPRFLRIHSSGGSLNGLPGGVANSIPALFSQSTGNLEITGRFVLNGGYNLAYQTALRIAGPQPQFSFPDKLALNGFQVGLTLGDQAYPYGIMSETTVSGLYTYGCPVCVDVIGTETIIDLVGCHLVSDVFGAPSSWLALPRRTVRSFGAKVRILGGEAIITDTTNGYIAEMRPLDSGRPTIEGCRYGKVRFIGVHMETASPFILKHNPAGLTLNQVNGMPVFGMEACEGFISQDAVMSFITDDADFTVIESGNAFDFNAGTRTQPVWFVNAASARTRLILDPAGMGKNFRDPFEESVNGVLAFDTRRIAQFLGLGAADGSTGQSLSAGQVSTLYYQARNTTGPLNRFSGIYDVSSGRLTGPIGGLDDVAVDVQFATTSTDVTGRYIVASSNGEFASLPIVAGRAGGRVTIGDLGAGEWVEFRALPNTNAVTSNNGPNGLGAFLNRVDVYARNR